MLPLIEAHRAEIAELCRRFRVRRLDVFGSAARGTPARSDVDLLVTYERGAAGPSLEEHFDLRDALAALFGREVDLVMSGAVRNPYIRADIERSKEVIYAA